MSAKEDTEEETKKKKKCCSSMIASGGEVKFLTRCKEKADFNQYWYSANTIRALVNECAAHGKRIACMSTPSIFFSMDPEKQKAGALFDFDNKFKRKAGDSFFKYDFNAPEDIPEKFRGKYDFLVIDPPFITKEVWEKYAIAAKSLITPTGGKILLTTIDENEELIKKLLGCSRRKFRPLIPHLVYQYSIYTNYESDALETTNSEIGF